MKAPQRPRVVSDMPDKGFAAFLTKRLLVYLVYALVTIGLLMVTADVAITARDALGLVGAGLVLIFAGFGLAGVLGFSRTLMGES